MIILKKEHPDKIDNFFQ